MPKQYKRECPHCKSINVVNIMYGYPGPELMEDSALRKVELGGCVIEEDVMLDLKDGLQKAQDAEEKFTKILKEYI